MNEKILTQLQREKLYEKMRKEFDTLTLEIKASDSIEYSMRKAYELVIKYETMELFASEKSCFNLGQIQALLMFEFPLDLLYQRWLDSDINLSELFEENIENEILLIEKKYKVNPASLPYQQ